MQAEAGLRPTVSVSGAYTYQNADQLTGPRGFSADIGGRPATPSSPSTSRSSPAAVATAKVDAAQADILAGREALRRTEISVLQSVIGAYLDVRRDQEQLAISQDNVNVLARQLEETNAQVRRRRS